LHAEIDSAVAYMNAEAEEEAMREEAEQKHFDELASSLNVDRETFNRWMATA